MKNDQAFPSTEDGFNPHHPGLTKREYFAGLALQGELANSISAIRWQKGEADDLARRCVIFADALIKELEKKDE